jgi:hypothetical protein
MLEPAMLIGLGAVAVWVYLRYPRLRPRSLVQAAAHVSVSFFSLSLLPFCTPWSVAACAVPVRRLGAPHPTRTYVLLSWVWLIARILHDLFGGPRGGHPVATDH